MSILVTRRPAFPTGRTVELHPAWNHGADERRMADRGTVLGCRPSVESPNLDIVTVVWRSTLDGLTDAQLDRPLSDYAVDMVSTRLRLSSPA